MSSDISEIILEELRGHRKETKEGFEKINGRVRSLEETRAEQRGAMRVLMLVATALSGVAGWVTGHFFKS